MSRHSDNPDLTRRTILPGLAAGAIGLIHFATRTEASTTTIPSDETHIFVRGLAYVADVNGTALTTADGRTWSPFGEISPLHFGELSEDDTKIIQATLDYAAELGTRDPWHVSTSGGTPMQIIISGGNALYRVTRPIELRQGNRHNTIRDFSIIAVGDKWTKDGGKGRVGKEHYFPARSDFTFQSKRRATFVQFENLRLNCNDLCGGIRVLSHGRVINTTIKKCAGVGILAASGDVWVDRCFIRQYDQSDVEFYDPSRYSGIGVMCEDSDLRLTHSVINWLAECVRIEGTNCNVAHCHIFNGCRGYLGSHKKKSGDVDERKPGMNEALSQYFGRTIDESTDLPPRTYHAGIVVTGPQSQDNAFDSIYFDNCHMEIYAHGVHFNEPKLGAKPNSSLWASPIDYWFAVYPRSEEDHPQIVIDEVMMFVESRAKRFIAFKPHPKTGHVWPSQYKDVSASAYNVAESSWGDRFRLDVPLVHVSHQDAAEAKPAITYAGTGASSFIGFTNTQMDGNSEFAGNDTEVPEWQAGMKFRQGKRCRVGENIYVSITPRGSKTGRTPPTHSEGVASDGKIDWLFLGRQAPAPVRMGAEGNDGRIVVPKGQLIIGSETSPAFRSSKAGAVGVRTGDSGISGTAPEESGDLVIESAGSGGITVGIPDQSSVFLTVSTPSDPRRFQIRFDDSKGEIQFYVGGALKSTI